MVWALLGAACADVPTMARTAAGSGPSTLTAITLETIDVTACQYGGTYPDCAPPPPSGTATAPGSTVPPSGGTGAAPSSTVLPPDTTRRPACNTGDPVLDAKAIQDVMRQLWTASNPTAASTWSRQEQGGWITSDGHGGYGYTPFSGVTYQACSITPGNNYAPPLPPGVVVVGWVHTHPFSGGEWAESCRFRDDNGSGVYITPTYRSIPSSDDFGVGSNINEELAGAGQAAVDGYMIDNEGIHRFRPLLGHVGLNFPKINRCGY